MVQQSNYRFLQTEQDFRNIQDQFYSTSKEHFEQGKTFGFKGLLEIISSPIVIQTAIHNIKSNKGSNTHGSDKKTIRDVLEKPFTQVVEEFQKMIFTYQPKPVRRVYIDKPGKSEKRPLGIPTISDRIVQECVRIVIEPILEAQFYSHSYGFRPQRDAEQAIARTYHLAFSTKLNWVIEGDISKFFDNVDHNLLLKKLWNMGIHDKRVLAVIKQMLKAGVMNESVVNDLGTPQGGIISPLLSNVYLNSFDWFVANSWDDKKTKHSYQSKDARILALRKSKLIPAFVVRYADDWVLLTDSKKSAEIWKNKLESFFREKLKLTLSDDKTKITNIEKQPIRFLGFCIKKVKGKSRSGWVISSKVDETKFKPKIRKVLKEISKINKSPTIEGRVHQINLVNSQIRGMINYYSIASKVSVTMRKYSWILKNSAIYRVVTKRNGELIKAKESDNLIHIHSQYTSLLPAVSYKNYKVAVTNLSFCKWRRGMYKIQEETPYTPEGRRLYRERTLKKPLLARMDMIMSDSYSKIVGYNKNFVSNPRYNFEYFLNRAYAFNRDKGKCKICSCNLDGFNLHTHHIDPKLTIELLNKVSNLASLCDDCHKKIHDAKNHSDMMKTPQWKKILIYREKLIA